MNEKWRAVMRSELDTACQFNNKTTAFIHFRYLKFKHLGKISRCDGCPSHISRTHYPNVTLNLPSIDNHRLLSFFHLL